jgi:hypothetical protein
LRLAQPGGTKDKAFVLLSPEDGSRTDFQNIVDFLNTKTNKAKKEEFYANCCI